jgi:hypothetical protein
LLRGPTPSKTPNRNETLRSWDKIRKSLIFRASILHGH